CLAFLGFVWVAAPPRCVLCGLIAEEFCRAPPQSRRTTFGLDRIPVRSNVYAIPRIAGFQQTTVAANKLKREESYEFFNNHPVRQSRPVSKLAQCIYAH